MSRDFAEMLETATPTDELMAVDTSFLDAYRRGEGEEFKRLQAQEREAQVAQPQSEAAAREPKAHFEEEDEVRRRQEVGDPQVERDVVERAERLDLEPDYEPGTGESERAGGSSQRGGAGAEGGQSTADEIPQGSAPAADTVPVPEAQTGGADVVAAAAVAHDVAAAPDEPEHETPGPLQLTDHQEAAQSADPRSGSKGAADKAATLPQSGFRLSGVKSQPHIKALPETIMSVLREQLRAAAVRELGVSDSAAREFSQRLSQGALVTAFLLAQLDLHIGADPATERAVELFRFLDPLLGSVVARLTDAEDAERARDGLLHKLYGELAEVRQTSAVIEQALAYSIADRTENFLRGSHNIHDAPITHKEAIYLRDKAREATRKQTKLEREREGRPMR
ncbi:hypothetical protein [Streptomyces sp. NPDC055036]